VNRELLLPTFSLSLIATLLNSRFPSGSRQYRLHPGHLVGRWCHYGWSRPWFWFCQTLLVELVLGRVVRRHQLLTWLIASAEQQDPGDYRVQPPPPPRLVSVRLARAATLGGWGRCRWPWYAYLQVASLALKTDLEYATFQFAFLLFSGTSLSVFWSWLVTPLVMTRSRG
jgi:hypothetical protein